MYCLWKTARDVALGNTISHETTMGRENPVPRSMTKLDPDHLG